MDENNNEVIVELMARHAHEAWMQAHKDQGVESRLAPWGEEFMVPFEDLSEAGREFDRVIMRAILAAFEKASLRVIPIFQ